MLIRKSFALAAVATLACTITSAQTLLLDLSAETRTGSLPSSGASLFLDAGNSVDYGIAFSTDSIAPGSVPNFFGGYRVTYENDSDSSIITNPLLLVAASGYHNGISLRASYVFGGPAGTGVVNTDVTGLIYAEGSIAAGSSLFARVLSTTATLHTDTVTAYLAPAVHIAGQWYVSLSDAFSFNGETTQLFSATTGLTAAWEGNYAMLDTSSYVLSGSTALPTATADAVGLYFSYVAEGIDHNPSNVDAAYSEISFDQLGYTASAVPEPATTTLLTSLIVLGVGLRIRAQRRRATRD